MVSIEYLKTYRQDGMIEYRVTARGHAEYAEGKEPDIVCAAVSQMLYTLSAYLDVIGAEQNSSDAEPFVIECTAAQRDTKIYTIFDMTMCGLGLLEEEYPDNVQLEELDEIENPAETDEEE